MTSFHVSTTFLAANDLWSFGIHPSGLVDTFILADDHTKAAVNNRDRVMRQSNIIFKPKQIQAWVSGMREGAGLQWRCRHGWATMGLKTTRPRLLKKTLMEKLCLLPIWACWKQLDSNLVQPRNVWTCGTIFQAMFLPPLAPFLTCSQQFLPHLPRTPMQLPLSDTMFTSSSRICWVQHSTVVPRHSLLSLLKHLVVYCSGLSRANQKRMRSMTSCWCTQQPCTAMKWLSATWTVRWKPHWLIAVIHCQTTNYGLLLFCSKVNHLWKLQAAKRLLKCWWEPRTSKQYQNAMSAHQARCCLLTWSFSTALCSAMKMEGCQYPFRMVSNYGILHWYCIMLCNTSMGKFLQWSYQSISDLV